MAKLGSFASYTSFRNVICRPYGARKCSGGMGDMFRGFAPTAIMCRPYRARKKQPNSLSKFSQIYFQNSAKFTFKKRPNSLSKNSQIHFQKTAKFTFKKQPNLLSKNGQIIQFKFRMYAKYLIVTLLAKLGSFPVGGRDSYPDQCNDTPPRRIGEAGKLRCRRSGFLSRPMRRPRRQARRSSHSAKV